jgi:CheY-like chemotaxis protein
MSRPRTQACIAGLRTLIVEDQYLIAHEVCRMLRELGCEPVGPAPNLAAAFELLEDGPPPDCAVLDVNLGAELIYPLAEELRRRGVPFLFATGYDRPVIAESFRAVPHLEKPFGTRELDAALTRVVVSPQARVT